MWDFIKLLLFIGFIGFIIKCATYLEHPEEAGSDAARFRKAYNEIQKNLKE